MADNAAPILNPNTPMAFYPPDVAYQSMVAIYVAIGALAIMCWDVLDNLRGDYKLLFKHKMSIATLVYFSSRIGSLGYNITAAIFGTAPTGHCARVETIADSFYPLALSGTGLLFFLRLRAIYNRNSLVVAFFFVLWLGLLACTMLLPIQVVGGPIGNTAYCTDVAVPKSAYAAILAPLIHDTLVFVAISYRLAQISHVDNIQDGFKAAVFGKYLPTFTKSLLLDGQHYYLLSLISNLVVVVMVFDTSVPIALRSMGASSNIVITNIMACRVYRRTKFGQFREDDLSTRAITEVTGRSSSLPIHFAHDSTTNGGLSRRSNNPNVAQLSGLGGSARSLESDEDPASNFKAKTQGSVVVIDDPEIMEDADAQTKEGKHE